MENPQPPCLVDFPIENLHIAAARLPHPRLDVRPVMRGAAGGVLHHLSLLLAELTLWLCQNSYWKWWFIVDFPMKNGDFLVMYSYVSLPEARFLRSQVWWIQATFPTTNQRKSRPPPPVTATWSAYHHVLHDLAPQRPVSFQWNIPKWWENLGHLLEYLCS